MSDALTIGTDPPAPQSTHGYSLNHFALVVYDITSMRHFYGAVLGMRHIMTYQVSPTYSVTYMGYPMSGSGFQTGEELFHDLTRRDGLLEFLHRNDIVQTRKDGRIGRFSHMGIVVPDVGATEKRMKEFGVSILKGLGADTIEPDSSVAEWWGLDHAHVLDVRMGAKDMEWGNILLVIDPDGNVVEVKERK
jgi:lactoylglutathione lyase